VADEHALREGRTEAAASDTHLVARLRDGDEAAFMTLVDRHAAAMLRVASMYVSRAVAEEAVQDTWVGVLQGIARFEERSSLKTWIFSILMNRVRTQAQRERRTVPFSAVGAPESQAGDEPALEPERFLGADHREWPNHWANPPEPWTETPEQRLLSSEASAEIRRAIDALPPGPREVITLRDVEGWTPDEVSDLLRITPNNQRVLLHRARSKVRRALELYFAGGTG